MSSTRKQNLCPHCGEKVIIRSSQVESPLLKTLYGQCTNLGCGWTGKAHLEWAFTMSPSAVPNPDIDLPFTPLKIPKDIQTHDIQQRTR